MSGDRGWRGASHNHRGRSHEDWIADPGHHVVTFVHGTFARKASWIRGDSELSRALGEKLRVKPLVFQWSGLNSSRARLQAAGQLRDHLRELLEKHRTARHYVIAHSHGGNVALYALQDEDLKKRISGVVCLSTPFLHVRERALPISTEGFPVVAAIAVIVWIWAFLVEAPLSPSVLGGTLLVGALCFGALTGLGLGVWLPRFSAGLAARLQLPCLDPRKLLIIRAPGDEATGAIVASHFVSSLFGRLLAKTAYWAELLHEPEGEWRRPPKLWWLLGLYLLIPGSIAWALAPGAPPLLYAGWELIALLMAWLLMSMPVLLLLMIAMVAIPMGASLAVASLFLDVSVEAAPPGAWTVHTLPPPTERVGSNRLVHGTHSDPNAIERIVDWIWRA